MKDKQKPDKFDGVPVIAVLLLFFNRDFISHDMS
jgi:hypothetical protein